MVRSHAGVPLISVFLLGWFQGHLGEAGFRVHCGEAVCLGLAFCFLSFIVHRPLGLAGTVRLPVQSTGNSLSCFTGLFCAGHRVHPACNAYCNA